MTFVKGVSGNPGGRPKKEWTWAKLLEKVGDSRDKKTGKKFKKLVSQTLWKECVRGNIPAIKELFNRMEGMPKQQTEIQGAINVFFHDSLKQKE